ncbi:hypothetical protein [Sinosporangium siamense]|uniref:Uncharacterized protein n=1 Tax=Sinosporangium siamense TaxID=1367973 RepID=A0A919V9V0_9ACTN|nr:hypothetical protein [Sinosporangium siamense]GII94727.1 hypothetical protein Ssi02_49580 [Sinosporangium siamense]
MNHRVAFIAAPLFTLAYGVIRIVDGFDGSRGPGLAWTVGHLAFLVALVMFAVTFKHMWQLAGRDKVTTVLAVTGITGIVAICLQFVIDIVVGFMSVDHAAMGVLFTRIQSVPGVSFAVYDVGPFLFYLGQLAVVVRLATMRRVKGWVPALVLVNMALPFVDKDLIPVGAVFLFVAFAHIAGQVNTTRPVPAPAR